MRRLALSLNPLWHGKLPIRLTTTLVRGRWVAVEIAEEALFAEDIRNGINLFLGAGFSILAKNGGGAYLPDGKALQAALVEELSLSDFADLDLQSLYAVAIQTDRDRVRDVVKNLLTVKSYDDRYDVLRNLNISSIYTTNIDDLIYLIFAPQAGSQSKALHDSVLYSAPRIPGDVINYVPLHGCVRHDDREFIFTPGQIASAFASDRESWYVFQRELQRRPTLFLGYGVKDAGVLQALHGNPVDNVNRWILIRETSDSARRIFESLGFKVIVGDTIGILDYFSKGINTNGVQTVGPVRSHPYGSIPRFDEAAQRPVKTFFLGGEPEWSDAYSAQIVKRKVLSQAKNKILSGKNLILVGVPLSGKSTILKQLAVDLSQTRDCIYFDRLSEPVANELVAASIGLSKKTLVFLDDILESRGPLLKLVESKRFQFVGAETSFYFDSVSFRPPLNEFVVESTSEVYPADRQRILDSIPESIKRNSYVEPASLYDSEEVGLFESLQQHVYDENLRIRFRDKLRAFEEHDKPAFDLYIMACYISACRTIASFDMLYMFIDKKNKTYGDVYSIVSTIDDFLTELELVDDPHQDYFSVRSSGLSRIALDEVSNQAFGRMFERFHAAVPTNVIPDFGIFRRFAYDNDYARRAFPVVKDGKRFYERLISTSDNPYDYQHGAVYLSKMRMFKEAFEWIDKAISMSRKKIFPIRNSHARILFEANIDVVRLDPDNSIAKSGIVESMKVLEDCILNDPRRSYHLIRFSDQCMQYVQVYNDRNAYDWLHMARRLLREALKEAALPGSREAYNQAKFRRVLGQVEQRIS